VQDPKLRRLLNTCTNVEVWNLCQRYVTFIATYVHIYCFDMSIGSPFICRRKSILLLSFIWSSWNGGQELTGNKQYSTSGDAITWSKRISILNICAHNSQMAITFLISHMLACARPRTSIVPVLQLNFDIQF
jgi:hypothetical protein